MAQILIDVPKKRLITKGPFALMLHPLYTSIALLVFPAEYPAYRAKVLLPWP